MFSWLITRGWFKQTATLCVFGVMAFAIAFLSYHRDRAQGIKPSFYQGYYEPAIRMACGQPFGVDADGRTSEQMTRFLALEQPTLACDAVPLSGSLNANPPTRAWYHLLATTAQIWKVTGISWQALDGLAAAMLAIAAVAVFALFRLLMPLPIAAVMAFVSMLPCLRFLPYLRDLNKAPFIVVALLAVTWMVVRTPTRPRLYAVTAALGLWLGIGYGFRPDVLIVLPLLIVTIWFFRPIAWRRGWLDSILLTLVLGLTFSAAASPAFSSPNEKTGSCTWHFGLLGLSEKHTSALGVTPAEYSWLAHYDDQQVARAVESYSQRELRTTDVGYCTRLYDQASRALFLDIVKTFPSDFMIRTMAATQQVAGAAFWQMPWTQKNSRTAEFFESHRATVYHVWVVCWGLMILILLASNIRIGLFALFALVYVSGYPAIQFELRHYFHLSFLTWLPLGVGLGWLLKRAARIKRKDLVAGSASLPHSPGMPGWARAVSVAGVVFGLCLFVYFEAHQMQTVAVQRLFERYLSAGGEQASVTTKRDEKDQAIWTIEGPGDKDAQRISGRMMRLDIGGPNCASGIKSLAVSLSGSSPGYEFPGFVYDRNFSSRLAQAGARASVFVPLYFEQPLQTRVSLILPRDAAPCVERVTWLRTSELPALWVLATLYPDWREARLNQSM